MKKKFFVFFNLAIIVLLIIVFTGCKASEIASIIGVQLPVGLSAASDLDFGGTFSKSGNTIQGYVTCTYGLGTALYFNKGNVLSTKISDGSSPTCTVTVSVTEGSSIIGTIPLAMIIEPDTSGSMSFNDSNRDIVPAGQNLATGVMSGTTSVSGTKVAVNLWAMGGTFPANDMEQPFTDVLASVNNTIALATQDGSATNFYDAALFGVNYFTANTGSYASNAVKTIVILTDGRENASVATLAEVISAANAINAQVHTVSLGTDIDEAMLTQLAASTNATYQHVTTANIGTFWTNFAASQTTPASISIDTTGCSITFVAGQTYTIEIVFVFTDASGNTTTTTETFLYTHS